MSVQTALYCWVCQISHEASFQFINNYCINGQNRNSDCLIKELGINNLLGNPTNTDNIGQQQACFVFLWKFNERWRKGYSDTSTGYKQRYIDGSAKFSTIPISKLSTSILSATKTRIKIIVTLVIPRVVWNRCGFKQILKICLSTNNQCSSPHEVSLKQSMFISSWSIIKTINVHLLMKYH